MKTEFRTMDAAHHLLFKKKTKKHCYSGTFNEVEMLGCGLCLIKCDHYCLHCEELDETAVQNASLHGSYCCVLYLVAS